MISSSLPVRCSIRFRFGQVQRLQQSVGVSCRLEEVRGEQLSVEVVVLPVDRLPLGDLCWVCVGLSLTMLVLLMLRWYLALAGGLFLVVSRCGCA